VPSTTPEWQLWCTWDARRNHTDVSNPSRLFCDWLQRPTLAPYIPPTKGIFFVRFEDIEREKKILKHCGIVWVLSSFEDVNISVNINAVVNTRCEPLKTHMRITFFFCCFSWHHLAANYIVLQWTADGECSPSTTDGLSNQSWREETTTELNLPSVGAPYCFLIFQRPKCPRCRQYVMVSWLLLDGVLTVVNQACKTYKTCDECCMDKDSP